MSDLLVALIVALVQILFWLGCALWIIIIVYSLWGFLREARLEPAGPIKRETLWSVVSLLAVPLVALAVYPVLKNTDWVTAAIIGIPLFFAILFAFTEVFHHPAEAVKGIGAIICVVAGLVLITDRLVDRPSIVALSQTVGSKSKDLSTEILDVWRKLPDATLQIEHSPLRQGRQDLVTARIGNLSSQPSHQRTLVDVKTTPSMTATLSGSSDELQIEGLSTPAQAVLPPTTEWQWRVRPLQSGQVNLHIKVTASLVLPSGPELLKDVVARELTMQVQKDYWFGVKHFARRNWQVIIGSPLVLSFLLWLSSRLGDAIPWVGRKREAGFK